VISAQRYDVEESERWHDWIAKIPAIQFDAGWLVRVIPPFTGAMVRFQVKSGDKTASVYLDVYERLGSFGAPYWEVYPIDGDVERCAMDDVAELLTLIRKAVKP
jgi:hypothetical protein